MPSAVNYSKWDALAEPSRVRLASDALTWAGACERFAAVRSAAQKPLYLRQNLFGRVAASVI